MSSAVSRTPTAPSAEAQQYFASLLAYETDCWDVNHAISNHRNDFILLDVRGEEAYATGHLLTAVNLPNWKVNANNLTHYPKETLFVVYCAGTHCNGADKAALHLATMGRPLTSSLSLKEEDSLVQPFMPEREDSGNPLISTLAPSDD